MHIRFCNINDIFLKTLGSKNIVKSSIMLDKKTKQFTIDGIFSELIFGDINKPDYSCKCERMKGKFHENMTCKECGTKVSYRASTLDKIGWIDLGDVYLINPIIYESFKKIMPIDSIINKKHNSKCTEKYNNIGLTEFKERYDEILAYYKAALIKDTKAFKKVSDHIKLIETFKDYIFTNKILITSINLRPATIINDDLKYEEVNIIYNNIINNSNLIKQNYNITEIELIGPIMYDMQLKYNELLAYVTKTFSSKSGMIRNYTLGTRLNFSTRSIIAPALPDVNSVMKLDELHLPYYTFLELYKFSIINILVKLYKISYVKANKMVSTYEYNETIYSIMLKLIEKGDLHFLLGRNPTISLGSVFTLKVTKVKRDVSDLTINFHNNLLPSLTGDYDGDALYGIPLFGFKELRKLLPHNMLIIDGKLNEKFNIYKEQIMALNNMLRIQ